MLEEIAQSAVYHSLEDVFREWGVDVRRIANAEEESVIAVLDCIRGDAKIKIEVIGDKAGDSPVGIWGHRDFARRAYCRADTALMRDLVSVLVRNGAEDPSARASQGASSGG